MVTEARQDRADAGGNGFPVQLRMLRGRDGETRTTNVVFGIELKLEPNFQTRAFSEAHGVLEFKNGGVVRAELRVHCPAGLGIFIQRGSDGKAVRILLESGSGAHELD